MEKHLTCVVEGCKAQLAAMHGEIRLAISIESVFPHPNPIRNRCLEDAGQHAAPLPLDERAGGDVDGRNVHRDQAS